MKLTIFLMDEDGELVVDARVNGARECIVDFLEDIVSGLKPHAQAVKS